MKTFATPEDAARDGLPQGYVRVVGVVVRGDEAVVGQVMNANGYPDAYEIETVMCHRTRDGWEAGSSGNDNMKFIQTGDDRCTVVWWAEAEEGATGAQIRLGEQEQAAPVEDASSSWCLTKYLGVSLGSNGRTCPRDRLHADPSFGQEPD